MNIQKYLAFVKTAECGSFTKAAEALSYTQSGISRMIGDLEREWNVRLLERGKGGVRLTSDGSALLPRARAVVESYRLLADSVDELNGVRSGIIRIGIFSSIASQWLPSVIAAFRSDHPNIDFDLLLGDYTEIESWIVDGRVDCGFLRLPAESGLETFYITRDEMMAVLPQEHPRACGECFPSAEFAAEPFILLERGTNSEVRDMLADNGVYPQVRITTWDDHAVMSMVECGLGLAVLPGLILTHAPYRITALPLDKPIYRDIGIAVRDRTALSAAMRCFLGYIISRVESGIAADAEKKS